MNIYKLCSNYNIKVILYSLINTFSSHSSPIDYLC